MKEKKMKEEKPFFSVVVPVYNKEPHIARSINSVLNQTFTDFELIIVCDPSTDNSNAEVAKFTDPRIRVFHRDEPGPGGYAARNLGIKEAKADWVAFLDADDEWYPEHLEKMVDLQNAYPESEVMSCTWSVYEGGKERSDAFSKSVTRKDIYLPFESYLFCEVESRRPIWTSVACINRLLITDVGMFPEGKITMGGDIDTWLRCIERAGGMTWSNYKGALYHKDSVNMVTRSSVIDPFLHGLTTKKLLGKGHSNKIKLLIKKRHNNIVVVAWNQNMHLGVKSNFSLKGRLFFTVQPVKVGFYYMLNSLPMFILKPLHRLLFKVVSIKRKLVK